VIANSVLFIAGMELPPSIVLSTETYVGDVDERECSKSNTCASVDVVVANNPRATDHTVAATAADDDDKSTKEFTKDDNDATDSNLNEIEQEQKSDNEDDDEEKDSIRIITKEGTETSTQRYRREEMPKGKDEKSKVESKGKIADNFDALTTTTTTTYDEVIVTLVEQLNESIDLEVNALLHSKYDCDNNGDDENDDNNNNDDENDNNDDDDDDDDNDCHDDDDNDGHDDDDKGELLAFEIEQKSSSVDLSKEFDNLLLDNDIKEKGEENDELSELQATTEKYNVSNRNLPLMPAATANKNEIELNGDIKSLLDSDGGVEQNVVLVEKGNNFNSNISSAPTPDTMNDNGKESNGNETIITQLISTRPTSRGKGNHGTKRIFKVEISSDESHEKSSLHIIRKGKTKESIKKITSESFQVGKSTTSGRILGNMIEDRTSSHLSKKQVSRDDDKWYNNKRLTKEKDEGLSFMRSTECFSNYICQTQRQLKQKAEEKKRCAKKIIV